MTSPKKVKPLAELYRMLFCATLIFPSISVAQNTQQTFGERREVFKIPRDLQTPAMIHDQPAAGKRVRHQLKRYENTEVYHALFLPENWIPDQTFPVIVEYAGNGPYQNSMGDRCSGLVEDCNLGYGISGGNDFIWICLPFVDPTHQHNQRQWWGDIEESVLYCREAVQMVINEFGGEAENVFITGFSRGAIACHYIGLHDDEIAKLWAGFICHSHFDGVRNWNYPGSDPASARRRLMRLKGRPVFISQEKSTKAIRDYLDKTEVAVNFELHTAPFQNHTDQWILREIPLRSTLRTWLQNHLK